MTAPDLTPYLRPTRYLDADHPTVRGLVERVAGDAADPVDRAVKLFHAVRDEIRYDPYSFRIEPDDFRASVTIERGEGFCVPKAIALAAVARAAEIPSRLGFADVRNHLSTERLRTMMGSDLYAFHGYAELFLEGRWVKATPTFNLSLCERFGVKPLDFDGRHDALFHAYDRSGSRHMEYVHDHGSFADFPIDRMIEVWHQHYPRFFEDPTLARYLDGGAAAFERDAAEEGGGTGESPSA